ncbi:MAG: SprT family zinc-dependent metalloprotease [Syntrophobacteraceae bacterium]|jgi:predicted metal-dependent hydrolase
MKELDFNYQVRKSARSKTLRIVVHPDNRVVVSAPAAYPQKNIVQFVEKKADWIRKAIRANLQRGQQSQARIFETGEKLLYLGREYVLRVERGNSSQVILRDEDICVRLCMIVGSAPEPSVVKEHLLKWYQARALAKVKEKVPIYAGLIGVNPRLVTIKTLKSRWGSCSIHGRISLAWHIMMAPEPILDYLIVHELCHMVHHNHSAEYWDLVATILPDHRQSRKWLRENGNRLKL